MKNFILILFVAIGFSVFAQDKVYFGDNLTLENYNSKGEYIDYNLICLSSSFNYFELSENEKMRTDILNNFLIPNLKFDTRKLEVNSDYFQWNEKHKYNEDGFYGEIFKSIFINCIK